MEKPTYNLKQMRKVAGNELANRIKDFFDGDLEKTRYFFYKPTQAFGSKSAYQMCLLGRKDEVTNLIGRLEHGIYS
jgi:uncharacterized protein (DUF2384 family)